MYQKQFEVQYFLALKKTSPHLQRSALLQTSKRGG